tara:strand:- start:309 stop:875 length:567 start_codon:yes stop_codon:yes gene_type:complete
MKHLPTLLLTLLVLFGCFSSLSFSSEGIEDSNTQDRMNKVNDEEIKYLFDKIKNRVLNEKSLKNLPSRKGQKFLKRIQPALIHIANTDYLSSSDEEVIIIEKKMNDFISKSTNQIDNAKILSYQAFMFFSLQEYKKAIRANEEIKQKAVTRVEILAALYSLSQLYFLEGNFLRAKQNISLWFKLSNHW